LLAPVILISTSKPSFVLKDAEKFSSDSFPRVVVSPYLFKKESKFKRSSEDSPIINKTLTYHEMWCTSRNIHHHHRHRQAPKLFGLTRNSSIFL